MHVLFLLMNGRPFINVEKKGISWEAVVVSAECLYV